jgi:hypothetical protein
VPRRRQGADRRRDQRRIDHAPLIRTRTPAENATSMTPGAADDADPQPATACPSAGCRAIACALSGGGATITGVNAAERSGAGSAGPHNCRRQRNSWLVWMPAWRATSEATAPGSSAAATIRSFAARDHRRRRCTDVITSTRDIVMGLSLGLAPGLRLLTAPAQGGLHRKDTQLPARKLLYRRGCASHSLGHTASHSLGHVTYPSFALAGGIVPPPRAAIGRRFSESDRSQITPPSCPLTRARRLPEESRSRGWHILNAGTDVTVSESRVGAEALKGPRQAEANPADEPDNAATAAPD